MGFAIRARQGELRDGDFVAGFLWVGTAFGLAALLFVSVKKCLLLTRLVRPALADALPQTTLLAVGVVDNA
jgi:hypothetical protein